MSKDTLTQLGLTQSNLRSCNLNNLNVVWVGSATTKIHYAHISFCSAESAVLVTFRSSKKKHWEGTTSFMMLQIIFMKCWKSRHFDIETSQHCRSLPPYSHQTDKTFHTQLSGYYHQPSRARSFWAVFAWWLFILRQGQYHDGRGRQEGMTDMIYLGILIVMVWHFQFSIWLPGDVPAADEERPGGVHQLHVPGSEDQVPGVSLSRGILPGLADHSDRWQEQAREEAKPG